MCRFDYTGDEKYLIWKRLLVCKLDIPKMSWKNSSGITAIVIHRFVFQNGANGKENSVKSVVFPQLEYKLLCDIWGFSHPDIISRARSWVIRDVIGRQPNMFIQIRFCYAPMRNPKLVRIPVSNCSAKLGSSYNAGKNVILNDDGDAFCCWCFYWI
jgi:hypothetical protein